MSNGQRCRFAIDTRAIDTAPRGIRIGKAGQDEDNAEDDWSNSRG